MKLHIPAKIIIGTIPLQVVTQHYQPQLSAQGSSHLPIQTPSAPPMADTLTKSNTRESGFKVDLSLISYTYICVSFKVLLVYSMKLKYINLTYNYL